jgi:hypothetical protein
MRGSMQMASAYIDLTMVCDRIEEAERIYIAEA